MHYFKIQLPNVVDLLKFQIYLRYKKAQQGILCWTKECRKICDKSIYIGIINLIPFVTTNTQNYGSKTRLFHNATPLPFENHAISYGSKTLYNNSVWANLFENHAISHGSKTSTAFVLPPGHTT